MQRLILTRLRHQTWAHHVDPASEWWHSVQLMGPSSDKLLSYFQSKHNWSFWLSSNLNSVRLVLVNTGQLIVLIAGIPSRNILCVHPQQCDTKTATNPSLTQSGVVAVIVDWGWGGKFWYFWILFEFSIGQFPSARHNGGEERAT